MKEKKIKRGRVYKVFYLLQCLNGFIKVEEELSVLGQDEYKVWTGDEMWALDGFAGVKNVHYYDFEKEGKSWWRKKELAQEALKKVLAELRPVKKVKLVGNKFINVYVPTTGDSRPHSSSNERQGEK